MSPDGDGRVDVAHGHPGRHPRLVHRGGARRPGRHQPAFPAIQDLLERGTTNLLPTTAPAAARGQNVPRSKVRDTVPMFPDAEDLALAGMGGMRELAAEQVLPRIRIKVVHGHLAFASHPVMVGHYAGDTINGAEAELDRALKGRLDRRKQLGLYPGARQQHGRCSIARPDPKGPSWSAWAIMRTWHRAPCPRPCAEAFWPTRSRTDDTRCAQGRELAGGPLGLTSSAGRRGRRWPADRQQHRGAAARRHGGTAGARRHRPARARSDGARRGSRQPGLARAASGTAGREFKDGFELDGTVSSPAAGGATCRATTIRPGGSRSRSPWRMSAASG